MKTAVALGTRPEIIKMTPVIRELARRNADYFILHTGQHYSYNLDKVFFEQLKLPAARYNLEVGSGSHAEQTAKILIGIENVLIKEHPDVLLAQGDTNSVLAAALVAAKLHITFGHVEAGLRSYDRNMPEEINRILADRCADYLFAPTEKSKMILLSEGIPASKVFMTGNTIVDSTYQNLEMAKQKGNALATLNLKPRTYMLTTIHRQENVDDRKRFASILEGLDRVAAEHSVPLVYPIHPRSRKMMDEFNLKPLHIRQIEPVDFMSFLQLENNARLILTDSGGVQEEACILGVPCVTLRDNTERPETIEVGANMLAGAEPDRIVECARKMLSRSNTWTNPFGDGNAGARIVDILEGNKMRILVTGGLGFIGSNLVPELRSRGHEVWVCDLRHGESPFSIRCDVSKFHQLERLLDGHKFDYVYHLAAEYGRWNGEDYYENLWTTNVIGTKNLLRIQEKQKFRMIFFSSAEVYGDYTGIMSEDVMDRLPIKQMNDYAMTKWVGELQVLNSATMFGTDTVRVRPVNAYGPHEHYSPYRGVVPAFIYKALKDEPYTVYMGHKRIFDYVEDTARTFANIVDNFKPGEVYNIGGREDWEHDIKYVSDLILKCLGKNDSKVTYKEGEPFTTQVKHMDFSKARLDLKHSPRVPLEEGIPKTIEWMKKLYG